MSEQRERERKEELGESFIVKAYAVSAAHFYVFSFFISKLGLFCALSTSTASAWLRQIVHFATAN